MKAFLASVVAVIGISIAAALVLQSVQQPSGDVYQSSFVRR